MTIEARIGAPPLLARTQYWYARTLLARGDSADRQRAEDLLTAARSTASTLGMKLLDAEAGDLLAVEPRASQRL